MLVRHESRKTPLYLMISVILTFPHIKGISVAYFRPEDRQAFDEEKVSHCVKESKEKLNSLLRTESNISILAS